MICEPCKQGQHRMCEGNDCECPRRSEDQQIDRMTNSGADDGLAETIFSNLLYGGSEVARLLTDGAGKPAVKVFIQQVLRAYKSIKC